MPCGGQQRQWSSEGWKLDLSIRKGAGKLGRTQIMKGVVGLATDLVFNSWFGGKALESLNLCFMT